MGNVSKGVRGMSSKAKTEQGNGAELTKAQGTGISIMDGVSSSLLRPHLQELGKIKIGKKGDQVQQSRSGSSYQVPEKLDYFLITRNTRGAGGNLDVDEEMMGLLGEKPKHLDVALLSNSIHENFMTYLGAYSGRKCLCYGNGEEAFRLPTEEVGGKSKIVDGAGRNSHTCPCELLKSGKCRFHGILTCILSKSPYLGGVYKFRTTSINSISSILSSLQLISVCTGGLLAALPLRLVLSPQTAEVGGKTHRFQVVNVIYQGNAEALMAEVMRQTKLRVRYSINAKQMEERTRKLLESGAPDMSAEEDAEVQEEFHPEQP